MATLVLLGIGIAVAIVLPGILLLRLLGRKRLQTFVELVSNEHNAFVIVMQFYGFLMVCGLLFCIIAWVFKLDSIETAGRDLLTYPFILILANGIALALIQTAAWWLKKEGYASDGGSTGLR